MIRAYNWSMDPGFTLAAQGAGWYPIDNAGGSEDWLYGRFVIVNDADDGDYELFEQLPEPDPLAGESATVRFLATEGGLGAQYPQQYFSDPRILQRLREIDAYITRADEFARSKNFNVNWSDSIRRAWAKQLATFGPWSTFDDAGQTALKIIAESGMPNARELSDALRATRSFREGQAAMAQAWEQSNQASNLLSTVKEIAGDIGALASSGGFKLVMLPFAVTGVLNLANNLAQNGITETIRQTAQGAVNSLNNALSFAQQADAATVAAEQAAQAATQSVLPDIFLETDIGMAQALANPVLPIELFTQPALPDIFAETDAGMAQALANPVLPPELSAPAATVETPQTVFDETDAGMAEALESGGQLPPDFVPATPAPPAPSAPATPAAVTAPAAGAGLLTQAATAVKAGAGLLSVAMAAGGSPARPGSPLQPGQVFTTSQNGPGFSTAGGTSMLIPIGVLLLAALAAKGSNNDH